MRPTPQPDDQEPKVLYRPTRRTLRWVNREFRKLMDVVPWQLWPDDNAETMLDDVSDEDELRKAVDAVKAEQAQQHADATEEAQAEKYEIKTASAAVEKFVRETLPGVAEPLLRKVSAMAGRPVHAVGGAPGNAFHGDHHDWHYAFEVGGAEAQVDSCGPHLQVVVNGRRYDYADTLDHDGALRFVTFVVELGLRTQR